jgi:hypothetical protein
MIQQHPNRFRLALSNREPVDIGHARDGEIKRGESVIHLDSSVGAL